MPTHRATPTANQQIASWSLLGITTIIAAATVAVGVFAESLVPLRVNWPFNLGLIDDPTGLRIIGGIAGFVVCLLLAAAAIFAKHRALRKADQPSANRARLALLLTISGLIVSLGSAFYAFADALAVQ